MKDILSVAAGTAAAGAGAAAAAAVVILVFSWRLFPLFLAVIPDYSVLRLLLLMQIDVVDSVDCRTHYSRLLAQQAKSAQNKTHLMMERIIQRPRGDMIFILNLRTLLLSFL